MKNIRTTVLGIGMILSALSTAAVALFDGDPNTNVNYELTFTAVAGGIGLILAREQKTSDKDRSLATPPK